jgi:hypothetical protein
MRTVRVIRRVREGGTIDLDDLPLRAGQTVEVIVLPVDDDDASELTRLGESGLTFWDNDIDDEVWNDALPPA